MATVYPAPRIVLADITANNIGTVKCLTKALCPGLAEGISKTSFYEDIMKLEQNNYCKLALYNDIPAGIICCRLDNLSSDSPTLYVSLFGVLASYRRQGIASLLLSHVLKLASSPPAPAKAAAYSSRASAAAKAKQHAKSKDNSANAKLAKVPRPKTVELHVQQDDNDFVAFLDKKQFQKGDLIKQHFKTLDPPQDAYLMSKTVEPELYSEKI